MKLRISDALRLPVEAVTQTFAILSKRGAGKTYTASVLVEEMLDANLHVVVADPIGVWWGLRASADGRGPGLPIVILGGDHGDAPLEVTAGQVIADLIVDDRMSCVLDLSRFRKGDQTRFMTDFCERLYHRNRNPLHLVLDEADAFAPQRPYKGQERLLGAVEDLVRRGRARGLGVTLVTQRSAVLNKDVLTQAEVLVALRTIAPQDRNAIDEWIRVHGTPEQREELMKSLPSLPIGTAWFWSPGWLDMFKRVNVRQRRTFDSSATPKVGSVAKAPRKLADVDLSALRERIAGTIEKAKADDPRELRRQIAELHKQLSQKAQPAPAPAERVEVQVIDPALVERLEEVLRGFKDITSNVGVYLGAIEKACSNVERALIASRDGRAKTQAPIVRPQTAPACAKPERVHTPANDQEIQLRAGERRMVQVLAQFDHLGGLTRDQLALLSGYTRSGTFDTYVGTIIRVGYAERRSDGKLRVTDSGRDYLGADALSAPTTTEELISLFAKRLKSGERAMLRLLVDSYPQALSRDELAQRTGYTRSGTFDTYVGTLTRNHLIEKQSGGRLRASETLFLS